MIDKKTILWKAHELNLHDGFINFWMGSLEDTLESYTEHYNIFEFGSMNDKFLSFLSIPFRNSQLCGIIMEQEQDHFSKNDAFYKNFTFHCENSLPKDMSFDIGFSHETFSMIKDMRQHAQMIWNLLSDEGIYYVSFGWHKNNPYTNSQKETKIQRNEPFYEYTLDYVADNFIDTGFEVGIKLLSLPYYLIYKREIVERRYGNIEGMIECMQQQKYLFSFRKRISK